MQEGTQEITPEDVLSVFSVVDGPGVLLSGDIAEHLGCSPQTARQKLQRLYDQGELKRRRVGNRILYWHTDDDREHVNYRDLAIALHGRECVIDSCDNEGKILAHHINGDRSNDDDENLTVLCRSHHAKVHWGDSDSPEIQRLHDQLIPREDREGRPRISVGFDADQAGWIQRRAEELDRSQAEVVRRAVEIARNSGASLAGDTPHHNTDTDLRNRINELENVVGEIAERVEGIERGLSNTTDPDQDDADVEDPELVIDGAIEASSDGMITDALTDWRPGRSVEEREPRRESGRAAIEWLRDQGDASAGEFKRELYPEVGLEDQSEEAWWTQTARMAIKQAQEAGLVEYDKPEYVWVGESDSSG